MSSEITEIISAMEFAALHGLRHFVHDDGKTRLALQREGARLSPTSAAAASGTDRKQARAAVLAGGQADPGIRPVTSPVPGLCHLSPDPASPPFVTAGARVDEGQTICVIEAMKVMTAIAAPSSGTITRILVANGSAVSVGELLMEIRK